MRVAVGEAGEADQVEVVRDQVGAFRAGQALGLQSERDVAGGGAPGQQRVLLEDDAPVQAGPGDRAAVDENLPGGGGGQPAEQVEQGGLAAAAGADDDQELAGAYAEGEVVERGDRTAATTPAREDLAHPVEADLVGAHAPPPGLANALNRLV